MPSPGNSLSRKSEFLLDSVVTVTTLFIVSAQYSELCRQSGTNEVAKASVEGIHQVPLLFREADEMPAVFILFYCDSLRDY
jgi:hypothetical protein